jgi:phage gp37-like protein
MIATIEDAIIERIQTAAASSPGLGYAIRDVKSYGGEFDDDLGQVIRNFPSVWVTFAGSGKPKPVGTSRTRWITPVTFAVMVGARNIRGERETRQGLKVGGVLQEVGVYQMLKDISLLLINSDLGLKIDYLKPGATRTLYNTRMSSQAMAVLAREWHTEFVEEQPREAIDPSSANWLNLGINYYLQPDDGVADLSDTITLR